MKILFVDDSWERANVFLVNNIDHSIDWAQNACEAIARVAPPPGFHKRYDLIMLDHSLGAEASGQTAGYGENAACLECGCSIVDWIVAHKELFSETRFIIHSAEEARPIRMTEALQAAGLRANRQPFGWKQRFPARPFPPAAA